MEPRKSTSKKWTSFPEEYLKQIIGVFKESFARDLGNAHLVVEGRIYTEEICLRVGIKEAQSLKQNNFEISTDFDPAKNNAIEKIYSCIDGAAALVTSFFDGQPTDHLPTQWKPFVFEDNKLFFQYSTVNTDLEAEADRLLGLEPGASLYNDELEESDFISEEAPEDDSRPPEGEALH